MSRESTPRRRGVRFLLLAIVLLGLGQVVRSWAGLELDTESLRSWVEQRGWLGPAVFVGLVACRQFLLLPSAVLLTAGGLLFGVVSGSVLGAIGLVASAAITFVLARGMGGEVVRHHVAKRAPALERYIDAAGPPVVFLTVAHPAGLMTAVFWAAGFSSVRILPLLLAVAAGGAIRAASYSFFGSTLLHVGSREFWLASGLLGAAFLLPLLHSGIRRRLLKPGGRPSA